MLNGHGSAIYVGGAFSELLHRRVRCASDDAPDQGVYASSVTLTNSSFENCKSVTESVSHSSSGGALYTNSTYVVANCNPNCGMISRAWATDVASVEVTNSSSDIRVAGRQCYAAYGGAIQASSMCNIANSRFGNCIAAETVSFDTGGGAIFAFLACNIANSSFRNRSGPINYDRGAVHASSTCNVT